MAATFSIDCKKADIMVTAWNGPLSIAYTGEAEGSLALKAPFGELTMPATLEPTEMPGTRAIRAFGNATMAMPDLATLEACIAQRIEPGMEADRDSYLTARDTCLNSISLSGAPIPMIAQIDIGIMPGASPTTQDVIVEIKRSYQEMTKAPSGRTVLESFPAQCNLVEK